MTRKRTDQDQIAADAFVIEVTEIINQKKRPVQGESTIDWSALDATSDTKHGRPKTTAEHYLFAYLRMVKSKKTPLEISGTKRSFYFYRAALIFVTKYKIQTILNEIYVLRLSVHGRYGNQYFEKIEQLLQLVEQLDTYKPDPLHKQLAKSSANDSSTLGQWTATQKQLQAEQKIDGLKSGPKQPMRQTNKKKGLSRLPHDWRHQYWEKVQGSTYANAVAVLYCTGCRPGELQIGVEVSLDEDQNLVFRITGIKTHSGKYGQRLRVITESVKSRAAEHLRNLVKQSPERRICVTEDPKKLSDTMRWHSKTLWPKQKYVVSPYSLRHQKSADVKAALSETEVAMVMGHRSDATQSYYAGGRLAKSENTVVRVSASNEVQLKPKNTPYPRYHEQNTTTPAAEITPSEQNGPT